MKFFLLTTVLAAAGVAAEEEITFLHEGSHVQCNGPVHNDCPSSRIAYTCENGLACCKWDHLGRNMNSSRRQHLKEDMDLGNGFGHCTINGPTAASEDDEDWAAEEWADEDELPEFLTSNKCQCNGNGDCGSGKYCHKTNCSPSEAEDEDEDEEEEELPGFLRGISITEDEEGNKCSCNNNGDCGSSKYCKSSNCNSHNGKKYGHCKDKNNNKKYKNGVCKSNNHKSGKNCNYKQCQHKDNSSKCKCSNNQRCVKGHNSCTTSGDNNGCCVSDFEGVAGLYVQDDEDFEGTE